MTTSNPLVDHAPAIQNFVDGIRESLPREALIAVLREAHGFGQKHGGDIADRDGASWAFLLGYLNLDPIIRG